MGYLEDMFSKVPHTIRVEAGGRRVAVELNFKSLVYAMAERAAANANGRAKVTIGNGIITARVIK